MPQTILERIATGDPYAVEACLQDYGSLVWSIARKLCPKHEDAEDAVQEVFIEVWRKADRFDPQAGSEATYISTIARRRLIDRYRHRQRELDTHAIEGDLFESISRHEEFAEISDEAARAKTHMQQLRPEQQQVLELSIMHGLSQKQIAKTTNLPLGTVKTHTRRGLNRLRELLGQSGAD